MDVEDYGYVRNIAWNLLIDAKISCLPVDLIRVAKLYRLDYMIDSASPRFQNAFLLSGGALRLFGLSDRPVMAHTLAVSMLAPLIILKALDVKSPEEICLFTDLPLSVARQRHQKYLTLLEFGTFETSKTETKLLIRFLPWIESV